MKSRMILSSAFENEIHENAHVKAFWPSHREEVLGVFDQMCQAVEHMHTQKPPIIHRDLKVENFLLAKGGVIKLCDFGSATTTTYEPDYSWTAIQVKAIFFRYQWRLFLLSHCKQKMELYIIHV